jgi:hypothetical protein
MSAFSHVVPSCGDTELAMVPTPVQGVLPKCLKDFTFSEVNSESEQGGGPNI